MWEEFREDYRDPVRGNSYADIRGVRASNGFELLNHKMDSDYFQTFVCRSGGEEFKFYARRWQGVPLDTYTVYVNSDPDRGYMNPEKRRQLFHRYAKDIEAALLIFPLGKILNIPVKEVLFNINPLSSVLTLVHAEDV